MAMTWTHAFVVTGALATVVGVGFVAGSDAARQLDGFYITSRVHEPRPAMSESRSSEWNEDVTVYADVTPVGSAHDAGPAERAFFDTGYNLGEIDRAVERQANVRVHRVRPERTHVDATLPDGEFMKTPDAPPAIDAPAAYDGPTVTT